MGLESVAGKVVNMKSCIREFFESGFLTRGVFIYAQKY